VRRRPTCRLCCEGAFAFALAAPWRCYCISHATRLHGRWAVPLRAFELPGPRCEHRHCGRLAAVLVSTGRPFSRRRLTPRPVAFCTAHARLAFEAASEPRRLRRLPIGWSPAEPDLATWRELRAHRRESA
jgi:hypothetical protein